MAKGEDNNAGVMIDVEVVGESSHYSPKIENNAKAYGYKAANLINLGDIVAEFNQSFSPANQDSQLGNIKVQVPAFEPVNGDVIKQHLNQYAPEWTNLFQQFTKTYKDQTNPNTLSEASIECLKKLQECITNCFDQHNLTPELFNEFLETNKIQSDQLLMIRSTGVHEDKADMVNPGGNESLPCKANIREISQALGRVAASYIGPKSLAQRLIAGDTHITDFPVMPGLIQQMIGEGMDVSQSADSQSKPYSNDLEKQKSIAVSGVIYSKDGASRLQVAPGHGEYVVNSKGRVDNFYISTQGVVYSEIAAKDFRLQPKLDENNKISLERQENPAELKYQPSIASDVAYYAHQFAQYLAEKYDKRMDIEFVYNPNDHRINIVQARAIPEGSRKGLVPSAIEPGFLAQNKANMTTIQGLQVITPEVNKVAVITKPSQVIICNTIEEALTQYNKAPGNTVGVIVQQPSPDTSHEAGVFNASAIPVMQVADIAALQELLKKNNHLIIDPQHSSIYQLPAEQFDSLDKADIEKSLYEEGILAKGIYASSLSGYVTPINYQFSTKSDLKQPVALSADPNIGQLITKAQMGDSDSTDQLLSLAYQAMDFRVAQDVETQPHDKAQKLRDNIATLSLPKIGKSNEQEKAALGYNLRAVAKSYKKGVISADLFQQTMIAGAELSVLLDKMSLSSDLTNKQQQDQAYLEYFNVQKKFTGMITGTGGKNILADSLTISLKQQQYAKLADDLINQNAAGLKVTDQQKTYLTESLKLGDYFLNEDKKKQWQEFCGKICTATKDYGPDELPAKRLGKLVNQLVSLGVHQQWLNLIFSETNNPENALQTLDKLEQDFTKIELSKIKEAKVTIDGMQAQIPQWSDPAKFPELFKGLQENIKDLNGQLKWQPEGSNLEKILILEQVNQLTDILDKSTKSLERSTLYPNDAKDTKGNDMQVVRFKDMITEFYDLMKVWVAEGKFRDDESAQESLRRMDRSLREKDAPILTKNEFNPSPYFAVNRATINITGGRSFPKTLEDMFTFVHQNMIVATSDLATETNKILSKQLPDLVSNLDMAFNTQLIDSGNSHEPGKIITPPTMISLKDQILTTEKNIPLRYHSCIANIKYNVKDGTSVKFNMFGKNEFGRWDNIGLDTYLQLTKAGIEFKILPRHDEKKYVFEYEIKIKEGQIASLINVINNSIDISYKLSLDNMQEAPGSRQKLLVDRLDLLSKFSNTELKKVANMAKIMLLKPEKFGQFDLLDDRDFEKLTTLFQFCNKNELVQVIFGNFGSLAEKLQNLYIDNISDREEILNRSAWEFLNSESSSYEQEIFINKLFELQNSEDDKLMGVFKKDILIQGSEGLVSVLDQEAQLFFIEKLFKLQDKDNFSSTVNEILTNNSKNWLRNLNFYNKHVLASKLLEQQDFTPIQGYIKPLVESFDLSNPQYVQEKEFRYELKQLLNNDNITNITANSLQDIALTEYKSGNLKTTDLQHLDEHKKKALFSQRTEMACINGYTSIVELINHSPHQINALTSRNALAAYNAGIQFDQLKNLNSDKFEALTSESTLQIYKKKYATFDDLKYLELEKIQGLTSDMAQGHYCKGVTFTFLKHCGLEEGRKLADICQTDPAKADKQQIEKCVEAIAKEYPDNNLEFNKAIDNFVDKLVVSREITNQGANNSPGKTRKYLVTTLEQLAENNPALNSPLKRIKLSNVAQNPELQVVAGTLANHLVVVSQNSNTSIQRENFVKRLSRPSSPTTQRG